VDWWYARMERQRQLMVLRSRALAGPQRARSELASDWLDGVTLCEAVKGFEEDETTIEMTILGLQSHQSQWTGFLLGGGDMVD
jgi:hypothetical protein